MTVLFGVLSKLSNKAYTPYGIAEDRNLKILHTDNLFVIPLVIRIYLILFFTSDIQIHWFIPFIRNTISQFGNDPWSSFIQSGGSDLAFPYGIGMLGAFLPISFIGLCVDKLFSTNLFILIGFKLSLLVFDYSILLVLALITKKYSNLHLLLVYWCSPLIIYTTYIHGQLDIVPISLLFICLCMIQWKRFGFAGSLLAIAVSTKFSMLIALPLILIFIYKSEKFNANTFTFIKYLMILGAILNWPIVLSSGFVEMVVETKEISKLYTLYLSYGENLKVYIIPIIYTLCLYQVWRLKIVTKDLFIIATGISFFSLLIFIPPQPGWLLWVIPFLSFYQIQSKKDILVLGLLFNIIALFNNFSDLDFNNLLWNSTSNLYNNEIDISTTKNLIFTSQQGLAILLAIRMYLYGIQRNSFYKLSDKPYAIYFEGNDSSRSVECALSIEKLLGKDKIKYEKVSNFSYLINGPYLRYDDENTISQIDHQGNLLFIKEKVKYVLNPRTNIFKIIRDLIGIEKKSRYIILFNDTKSKVLPFSLKKKINTTIVFSSDIKSLASKINNSYNSGINTLWAYLEPININLKESNANYKQRFITILPMGFLHDQLLRLFISVSSIHIDTEILPGNQFLKMTFEGYSTKEDISEIANVLIPQIEDLSIDKAMWSSGYLGIIQIILLSYIAEEMQDNKEIKDLNLELI